MVHSPFINLIMRKRLYNLYFKNVRLSYFLKKFPDESAKLQNQTSQMILYCIVSWRGAC
jgi:hypothetical protein